MTINLTTQEITDIRRALILAMKACDDTGNDNDIILANRLEKIDNKLIELQP